MKGAFGLGLAALTLASCQPNPRNEIAAVAEAGMAQVAVDFRGAPLCVERSIEARLPSANGDRPDPQAPPTFAFLLGQGVFSGGGALKGKDVAGVPVRSGAGCFWLEGPLIARDRAMLEVHLPPFGFNLWMRKVGGKWRVTETTRSYYPD